MVQAIKGSVGRIIFAWWVNSRATVHMCKDKCWFKTYESLNDRSIHHMGNKSTTLVHGHGCVYLRLNIVNDNIGPAFMSTFKLNDSILWHARLGHVHYKRMQDMSKDGLILAFDMDTEKFVRLPNQKLKTLGERGIECIFVGYAEHSKAFSKFDEADKRVIICLYVDDMLIFGTDQVQIDLANDFLSSRFSMKDMREADVILGIRNKHESNGITISLSHYIEKHWQAIQRVLKYLKKTMDYRLTYTSYPSVLEGYTDASWISNTEDNSSTSGWVFLLGGGAIS
ncbi:zinc finger, CCHC-type containing protein [Tanacetum coccineum]